MKTSSRFVGFLFNGCYIRRPLVRFWKQSHPCNLTMCILQAPKKGLVNANGGRKKEIKRKEMFLSIEEISNTVSGQEKAFKVSLGRARRDDNSPNLPKINSE